MMTTDRELLRALVLDGEKLRQLTHEDHGPWIIEDCAECGGAGIVPRRITAYEPGCGFPHDDTDELKCDACDGHGVIVVRL